MTAAKEDITTQDKKAEVEAEPEAESDEKKKLTGPEIFTELKKLIPTVVEEDYKKGMMWQTQIMLLDAELVRRHRVECGAEEIETGLEEYDPPAPEVWTRMTTPVLTGTSTMAAALAANLAKAAAFAANLPKAKEAGFVGVKPVGMQSTAAATVTLKDLATGISPATAPATATAGSVTTSSASDLRQIAVFVAQWKLDPTKTKLLLAKFPPARRRWIIANFKNEGNNGASSMATLEAYIQANPDPDSPAVAVKRPAPVTNSTEPAKKPALTPGIVRPVA